MNKAVALSFYLKSNNSRIASISPEFELYESIKRSIGLNDDFSCLELTRQNIKDIILDYTQLFESKEEMSIDITVESLNKIYKIISMVKNPQDKENIDSTAIVVCRIIK